MEEVNSKNVPANLSGEDFGKTLDAKLLKQLQANVAEQQKAMIAVFALYGAGLILLTIGGQSASKMGFIDIVLILALALGLMIAAAIISVSKRNKVKKACRELGVTEAELRKALVACKKRIGK